MAFSSYKARDINELVLWLNGGIQGVDVSKGINGLVGKTLTFTAPAAFSVTFTAVTGSEYVNGTTLRYQDIKQQIEAANAAIRVTQCGGCIWLVEKSPTNGVALAAASSAVKALFGFDAEAATSGRVLKQLGSASGPRIEDVEPNLDGSYTVLVWEG